MSLSRFPSTISARLPGRGFGSICGLCSVLGVFGLGLATAGCGDDSCGPGGAPATGMVAGGSGVTMTYGQFTASPNNDCPDSSAPAGVVSLSIEGLQTDG